MVKAYNTISKGNNLTTISLITQTLVLQVTICTMFLVTKSIHFSSKYFKTCLAPAGHSAGTTTNWNSGAMDESGEYKQRNGQRTNNEGEWETQSAGRVQQGKGDDKIAYCNVR